MEMRALGPLEVSVVGLGCNNFGRRVDEASTLAVVDAALEAGVTFFDRAERYGDGPSEKFLGQALSGRRDRSTLVSPAVRPSSRRVPAQGCDRNLACPVGRAEDVTRRAPAGEREVLRGRPDGVRLGYGVTLDLLSEAAGDLGDEVVGQPVEDLIHAIVVRLPAGAVRLDEPDAVKDEREVALDVCVDTEEQIAVG